MDMELVMHKRWKGKIEINSKIDITSKEDLAVAYTPGVAKPCIEIAENSEKVYDYTMKSNTIAIISDGSAVLGLGNIGPLAALPVMEGKAVLFKKFGEVNAFPICLDTQDVQKIIETVVNIAPAFGGINLEDISAPRCFEIEEALKEKLHIPVFHDDQHGTAIAVLAGLKNALEVVKKKKDECRIVINGAGSAGIAIAKLLIQYGIKNIIMCDKSGILSSESKDLNWMQKNMMKVTNRDHIKGTLREALIGADVFIGVSAPDLVSTEMVKSMNTDAIVFALANPVPEIMPELAKSAGARIVCSGRSDYPNQVNNLLVFPGLFKGVLENRVLHITDEMKLAVAEAIASLVTKDELCEEYILPEPFDFRIAVAVSKAIKDMAEKERIQNETD